MPYDVIQTQRLMQGCLQTRLINSHIIKETVKETDTVMSNLKTALIAARADNTLMMPYCMYMAERLENSTICSIPAGPFDAHMSDLSLESIEKVIVANNYIASNIIGGLNQEVIEFLHGKHLYIATAGAGPSGSITKHMMVKPDVCPKCLMNVTDGPMEDHMKSLMCMDQIRENMIAEKKLVQVNSDVETELIRAGVIPFEYHPIGFGMYIEPWVDTAIRSYESQKSRGAFTDMPLSEYLKHMV